MNKNKFELLYCIVISQTQLKYNQKHPKSFTGKERDSETGFSYFGARYYDSDILTSWLSVDPMADKYPGLSPYAYCAWNPIKLVDPDGEEIWIVNSNGGRLKYTVGMSSDNYEGYTKATISALNELYNSKEFGNIIQQLAYRKHFVVDIVESNETITKLKGDGKSVMHNSQEIKYNPYEYIYEISTGKILTPATALAHEFGHILNGLENYRETITRDETPNGDWTTKEEEYNIKKWEIPLAKERNEIIRTQHKLYKDNQEIYRIIQIER